MAVWIAKARALLTRELLTKYEHRKRLVDEMRDVESSGYGELEAMLFVVNFEINEIKSVLKEES